MEKYAFLRYAATQWDFHASHAMPLSTEIISLGNILHDPSGSSFRLYSEVALTDTYGDFTKASNNYGDRWPPPLYFAVESGFIEIVEYLLDREVNIDGVGGNNHTALQLAARLGKVEVFELLLLRGADPSIKGGISGSALNAAAGPEAGPADAAESIVATLLTRSVDVEARDPRGWTPMHYGCRYGGYFSFHKNLIAPFHCLSMRRV